MDQSELRKNARVFIESFCDDVYDVLDQIIDENLETDESFERAADHCNELVKCVQHFERAMRTMEFGLKYNE